MCSVINDWFNEGDFIDTYKTFNPDGKSFTYRVREVNSKKVTLQARLDYGLASRQLFARVTEVQFNTSTPYSPSLTTVE